MFIGRQNQKLLQHTPLMRQRHKKFNNTIFLIFFKIFHFTTQKQKGALLYLYSIILKMTEKV